MYKSFREAAEHLALAVKVFTDGDEVINPVELESTLKVDCAHKLNRADFLQGELLLRILQKAVMTASLRATVELLYPRTWRLIMSVTWEKKTDDR